MLLNIAPDTRGLFPEEEELRLREFGAQIRRRFGLPLKEWTDFSAVDGGWEWTSDDWRNTLLVDHVVVQEDLTEGESVARFRIDVWPEITDYPSSVYRGTTIGHRAICRFPATSVHKVRIEIEEARGPVRMRNAELHLAGMQ
jgi:alpha-L-fucosidase